MKEAFAEKQLILSKRPIHGIDQIEDSLKRLFNDDYSKMSCLSKSLIESGGKRIRPTLTLCSCQCAGPLNDKAIAAGTAIEVIHTASLVHDDVIDNSNIRRNRPTINYTEGNRSAVLCGDYLFAIAFQELSQNNDAKIMSICVNAIKEMCQGELLQSNSKFQWNLTEQDYYLKIYKKTGALLAASCECGANAAGTNQGTINSLRDYGINIGYAYQIVDDVLDIIGDEKIIGKPTMRDILEGDITLPVILYLKDANCSSQMKKIISTNKITISTSKYIQNEIISKGIVKKSLERAKLFVEKAKFSLINLKDSDYKDCLINIADTIINREF